ncbi:MAG: response regulator [Asticcacaulis sp.]|uniref:response regulator n=1 Tax=Asticcacaulis sp. TaxID=1872648 RepID=UPI0039E4B238
MSQVSAATNRLVLLVDDNDETAFVIESMLDLMDFGVERARDGREALEMSGISAYALILMDIEMPVMDGLAATKAIRGQEGEGLVPPVPIVGITGHSDMGTRRLCQLAGMDEVLCKPFLMEQLEEIVTAVSVKRVN